MAARAGDGTARIVAYATWVVTQCLPHPQRRSVRRYYDKVGFGNGWNLTQDQWRQLHVLEWLHDRADGRPDYYVTTERAELARSCPGDSNPAESLGETFELLYQQRLVSYVVYTGDVGHVPPRVELTHAGVEAVQQIRRLRADPAARRPAARDALLRWLYDRAVAGERSPQLEDFWQSGYSRFLSTRGGFFTTVEINDASRWLNDEGYLTGAGTSAGAMLHPVITPKGERLVENGRSTSEDREVAGDTTITITNSTGVNVANRSAGVTQAVAVTITEERQRQIRNVADYLEQTAAQLGASTEDVVDVPRLVAELRAMALEPAADRGRLQRLLDTVRQLAIGAASGPLGAGLEALVHQAAHALGLS